MGPRKATAVDAEVGKRIRSARLEGHVSQEKLAAAIGVTFQQVQKYESGINRVSVSRLISIGAVLGKSPSHFIDGLHAQ